MSRTLQLEVRWIEKEQGGREEEEEKREEKPTRMPAEHLCNGDCMTDERLIIDDRLGSVDQLVCDSSESVILVKKCIINTLKHTVKQAHLLIFFWVYVG